LLDPGNRALRFVLVDDLAKHLHLTVVHIAQTVRGLHKFIVPFLARFELVLEQNALVLQLAVAFEEVIVRRLILLHQRGERGGVDDGGQGAVGHSFSLVRSFSFVGTSVTFCRQHSFMKIESLAYIHKDRNGAHGKLFLGVNEHLFDPYPKHPPQFLVLYP
jgi:hypothetical protein